MLAWVRRHDASVREGEFVHLASRPMRPSAADGVVSDEHTRVLPYDVGASRGCCREAGGAYADGGQDACPYRRRSLVEASARNALSVATRKQRLRAEATVAAAGTPAKKKPKPAKKTSRGK